MTDEAEARFPAGDPFGLKDKVCAVTGGGSGIGRGIAEALAAAGARVVVLDRSSDAGEETVARLEAAGGTGAFLACDVSDPASVDAAALESSRRLGPCDVLVNNAGRIGAAALDTIGLAEWNALLAVNLTGYLLCAQGFGRQMRPRGKGALVHVGSIAATHATAFSGAYSVAKAGLTMLSRQLAIEWGAHGIRSNVVHPGLILTPLSEPLYAQEGVMERRRQAVPAGRIGRPDDVAQAVLFLASDRAAYVTGDEITVDGGFTRMLLSLVPRAGFQSPGS